MEVEAKPRPRWLRCCVQNYDWGRKGEDSTVGRLFSKNSGAEVTTDMPYAELWMGTHASGPSFLLEDESTTLKSLIRENPTMLLGDRVACQWGCDLPFLFKVLSVAKALSIQAHPDKKLAGVLHKMHPCVYKDENHKPEMAVAITEFRALCGFVSLEELKNVFSSVPEIAELVGSDDTNKVLKISSKGEDAKVLDTLKSIFTKFMTAKEENISELIYKLRSRLTAENKVRMLTEKERLALELEKQYPNDIGVISSFFFNYVKLNPGEALYLGPNEPHAYISGECIECMATSDNVVRAGLTSKFRDVQTLSSMLTYKQGFPEILKGVPLNKYVSRYSPPFEEFEVDWCFLPSKESMDFSAIPGPSLFLIFTGKGEIKFDSSTEKYLIMEGDVLFVPAETQTTVTCGVDGSLILFRAGVNGRFFE